MPRRSPAQQLRARRTRRQLLAAARRVFARKGYDGATVDDICTAARCSKGAYYFHFGSKEESLLSLVDSWISERTQTLAHAVRGVPSANGWRDAVLALGPNGNAWPPALLLEFWAQAARNDGVGRRLQRAEEGWHRLLMQRFRSAPEAAGTPDLAETALTLSAGITARAGRAQAWSAVWRVLARSDALRPTG